MTQSLQLDNPAPDFCLADFTGRQFCLSDYRNRLCVVLVFNRGFA